MDDADTSQGRLGFYHCSEVQGEQSPFSAEASEPYTIHRANGGFLAAVLLRAVAKIAQHPQPLHISVEFFRQATLGELHVEVRKTHRGLASEFFTLCIVQDRREIACANVWLVAPRRNVEENLFEPPMPQVPAPNEEALFDRANAKNVGSYNGFWSNFREFHVTSDDVDSDHVLRWLSYKNDNDEIQCAYSRAARLLPICDVMWAPAVYRKFGYGSGVTLHLEVSFNGLADGIWFLAEGYFDSWRSRIVQGGCRVWSQDGNFLASSRCTVRVRHG